MSTTLAPAVKAVRVEIEAFDLSTANLKTQIQQAKPEIKDIGDLLEVAGVKADDTKLRVRFLRRRGMAADGGPTPWTS